MNLASLAIKTNRNEIRKLIIILTADFSKKSAVKII